ncbi:uncharacterized protein LOC117336369 [Pecten maximus]|uniref:uncharacterized protein LOC117336369 n=1 Tax=Pecten maximus TaxID=6579 RepID=UPI001459013F|nr:uncharacterized protein LOC117336369 [Pecten maximus]
MTPSCMPNTRQVLFLVPQFSRPCSVTIATPFNVTEVKLVNGLSRRLKVDCVKPKWNSLGEIGGQIRSSCELSVYVEYRRDNYLVHPLDVAGNKYTVVVPTNLADRECFTIIFPVRNATNITIVSEATTSGSFLFDSGNWTEYNSKYKMMVTLHEFEAIYIKCTCSLSGVEISSPNTFMVVAGALLKQRPQSILIEQLSPESTWGREFLFPVPSLLNVTVTLYLMGKNDTADILINTNSVKDDFLSVSSFPYTLEIEADEYIHIESLNSSILPMVLMEIKYIKKPDRYIYMSLPSTSQCLPRHRFNDQDARNTSVSLWGNYGYNYLINSENLTMAGHFTNWTRDDIYLYLNIQNYDSFTITPRRHKTLFPSVCGIVEIPQQNGAVHLYSLGMRQTSLFDSCVTSGRRTVSADGKDNDCDGLVDEELRNRRDDDGDGFIDEDIGTWASSRRQVNSEEEFVMETSVIAVIISIVVALVAVLAFIGGMVVADQLMGGNSVAPVLESPDLQ